MEMTASTTGNMLRQLKMLMNQQGNEGTMAETDTRFGNVALLVLFHSLEEDVKQALQVCGTGLVLWMELNTGEKKQHVRKN